MPREDIALLAHLMRRAGFGATPAELDRYAQQGYAATVEQLLNVTEDDGIEKDIIDRYYIDIDDMARANSSIMWWMYRMINTRHPLQEKVALFWHSVFATAYEKLENGHAMANQIEMFRQHGLGNLRNLLVELSRDPAMIIWLDNRDNHKGQPNENWGRELLELFSMGVGMDNQANYTEEDVKMAARSFTGWTIANHIARYPWGPFPLEFEYRPWDHDDSEKTFLGRQGRFNGEDIIDILMQQPATARFISRHMYNFFVADEEPVPSWPRTEPDNPAAIKMLEDEFFRSNGDIKSMLRVLFNSEHFKKARFAKVKSPAELVISVLRLVGDFREPRPGLVDMGYESMYMGQHLCSPPTVEGWHTGKEWIDSGALVSRVNFAADQMARMDMPGVRDLIGRLKQGKTKLTPEQLVQGCLDLLGPLEVMPTTRESLLGRASQSGDCRWQTPAEQAEFDERAAEMLKLIVATREYQFA